MNMSQIKDELDRQYTSLLSLPEKAFFVGLANYTRFILGEPDLTSARNDLSRKASSDYKSIYLRFKKNHTITPQADWTMADFVKAGRSLARKQSKIQSVLEKDQTDSSHAWMKLQTVEVFINDRNRAERIYSKTPRARHEYQQMATEIDTILHGKKRERDFGIGDTSSEIPRYFFVKDDFVNYLNLVQNFLSSNLNDPCSDQNSNLTEKLSFIYQNKCLNFTLADGSNVPVDFSTSPGLRKVFEVFWEMWRRDSQRRFTMQEALDAYKELFKEETDSHIFGNRIHQIRNTKISKKSELENRFQLDYNKDSKDWLLILK